MQGEGGWSRRIVMDGHLEKVMDDGFMSWGMVYGGFIIKYGIVCELPDSQLWDGISFIYTYLE